MNRPPPTVMSTATLTNSSTYVEKLMIGLDHAPPAFDLRSQIIGVGGANLIYIRNETGAVATLRGRGSLFIDPALGNESPEPMHLYIEHTRLDALQNAKQLARNLIETLQQELAHYQQINPPGPANASTSVQSMQYPPQHVQSIQATHTQVSMIIFSKYEYFSHDQFYLMLYQLNHLNAGDITDVSSTANACRTPAIHSECRTNDYRERSTDATVKFNKSKHDIDGYSGTRSDHSLTGPAANNTAANIVWKYGNPAASSK